MLELFHAETLEAFGLILARTSAMLLAAPILGIGTGFSGYKIALCVMISLVLYVAIGEPLPAGIDGLTFAAMMVRELLIGAFIGLFLQLALVAIHVAGEMIGNEMGFMVGRQADPVTGVQSSMITSLYQMVFMLAFLSMNGHHWLIRSLDSSFDVAPIGRVTVGNGMGEAFEGMFSEMFRAGIVFAAPVMVFLFIISVLIGILSRAVPTLNVLELGFTLRVVVALIAMTFFAPLLEPSMTRLHGRFLEWLDRGLVALG